jgi:amidase
LTAREAAKRESLDGRERQPSGVAAAYDPAVDNFATALDLAAAVRRKEVSPVELVDHYLARIDELNPALNAVCFRADDEVRAAAARAADAVTKTPADELPPFHGVPLPIKDLNNVAGWPTTYGSRGASSNPVTESDLVVQRFVDGGFVLLAKTATPEFGTVSYTESDALGVTRNPWNTDHTPGGSSGGAGSAVASGMAAIAHASDGGGSIRIPASCNGLVGLKASRNRIPNAVNELEGFATSGVLTRTVADTAAALDLIGAPDPLSWYNAPPPPAPFAQLAASAPPRLRVAITSQPPLDMPVAQACIDAVEAAAKLLESLGHEIVETTIELPDAERFVESFGVIWNTGSAGLPLVDWDAIEPLNAMLRVAGQALDSVSYVASVMTTQVLGRPLMAAFGRDFDVLVSPTMAVEPPKCGSVWDGADVDPINALLNCYPMAVFTSPWNVTGLPALSLPLYQAPSGLPVGVQFVGGPWQDALLLQLGAQLEAAAPWHDRHPTLTFSR